MTTEIRPAGRLKLKSAYENITLYGDFAQKQQQQQQQRQQTRHTQNANQAFIALSTSRCHDGKIKQK